MNQDLQKVLQTSTCSALPETYIYCKVRQIPPQRHFLVTRDADEITVVTTEEKVGELDLLERNKDDYRLIDLNVSLPFYAVGFLAAVSGAIAAAGMNILIISTYSKDYILVRVEHLERTLKELEKLGIKAA